MQIRCATSFVYKESLYLNKNLNFNHFFKERKINNLDLKPMKKIYIITFMLLLSAGLYANRPSYSTAISFEPGETVYIEIPGFEVSQVNTLKTALTSSDIGAVWMGYCYSFRVICIKYPASGQEVLENALKELTGGFKIYSATQVTYSLTDACFNNE